MTKSRRHPTTQGISRPATGPRPDDVNTLAKLFAQHQYPQALALAQSLTQRFPQNGIGWKALGVALSLAGQTAEALAAMQKAAELLPNDPEVHCNLAGALKSGGRAAEAQTSYRRALQLLPRYPQAHASLADALALLGQREAAAESYARALEIKPDYLQALINLANLLLDSGQLEQAEARCRQALQVQPDYAQAHYNLGNILKRMGRLSEAEMSFRQSLALAPNAVDAHDAAAHNNLGRVLKDLGRPIEAELSYRRALALKPDYADAYCNLGVVLADQGRYDEAEVVGRLGVQFNPESFEAHFNLGNTLRQLGRYQEARTSYQRALQISPDFADALNNLANTLKDLGLFDQAERYYRKALMTMANPEQAFSNLLFTLNCHPDQSAQQIFQNYRAYNERFGLPHHTKWRAHTNDRNPLRRLRVGYVSGAFHHHSCRLFLEPLLARHDPAVVELFAYAEMTVRSDAMTERYQAYFQHWCQTQELGDDALAERIRVDGIDILVDITGHANGNRMAVFARKPAPVSLHWLDFGYTTGLTAIDYYLTDWPTVPAGSESVFSETPWHLPGPSVVYRPSEGMGEVSTLPATRHGHVTFGTLTRSIRVNYRMLRVWAAILKRLPDSQLVIDSGDFKNAQMKTHTLAAFAALGIARNRLQIGCHSPPWALLREIDIGLDCFPHNSGTTLFESLYMGVPFVTKTDRPSVGRLGASVLTHLGHPEWIATTEAEYVEMAVALAQDQLALSAIRAGLRDKIQCSPLMDEVGFARQVESAYQAMFRQWLEHQTSE